MSSELSARHNNSQTTTAAATATAAATTTSSAIDTHPYSRGATIEVLWNGYPTKKRHNPDVLSFSSSSDDDDDDKNQKKEVRLCSIIDRCPLANNKWRYYVHYRDFNRRMDEWISHDRIVSPPSVASLKAKAALKEIQLKKKAEDEAKRMKQQQQRRRSDDDRDRRVLLSSQSLDDYKDSNDPADTTEGQRLTRRQKRKHRGEGGEDAIPTGGVVATLPPQELDEHEGMTEASLREHEEVTKIKNVGEVELGPFRMETWYFSPIPKELTENGMIEVLYVCEFSLMFFARKEELLRFQSKASLRRYPPGNEIYRNQNLSMFEVDGYQERIYCQNLCYIAKLFLDHKTLYYDVDPFLFYILCEVDERGYHPVGYFSKEKYSDVGYNLACILTFPSHQRKGYGRFLIAFSYELSKREEKVGSPEKPMSDLGQQAYKPYWTSTIVDFLCTTTEKSMSIMDISKRTSIMAEDIIFTLNQLGILKFIYGVYFITADNALLDQLREKHPVKEPRVDPNLLHWTPFLTDIKRDKFSIHSKRPSVEDEETRGTGGF